MGAGGLPERLSGLPGVLTCTVAAETITLAAAPGTDVRLLRARAQVVCAEAGDARGVVVVASSVAPSIGSRPRRGVTALRRADRPGIIAAASAAALALIAALPVEDPSVTDTLETQVAFATTLPLQAAGAAGPERAGDDAPSAATRTAARATAAPLSRQGGPDDVPLEPSRLERAATVPSQPSSAASSAPDGLVGVASERSTDVGLPAASAGPAAPDPMKALAPLWAPTRAPSPPGRPTLSGPAPSTGEAPIPSTGEARAPSTGDGPAAPTLTTATAHRPAATGAVPAPAAVRVPEHANGGGARANSDAGPKGTGGSPAADGRGGATASSHAGPARESAPSPTAGARRGDGTAPVVGRK